ncbi:hypothetical protein [Mycolicibacterium iranicum]|nr:hypothetical protein [Mycolicibacterium iranicum]
MLSQLPHEPFGRRLEYSCGDLDVLGFDAADDNGMNASQVG